MIATAPTRLKLQVAADDFDKLWGYIAACKKADTLLAADAEQEAADAAEREIRQEAQEEVQTNTVHLKALKDAADAAAEKARTSKTARTELRRQLTELLAKVVSTGAYKDPDIYRSVSISNDLERILEMKDPRPSTATIYACQEYLKLHRKLSDHQFQPDQDRKIVNKTKEEYEIALFRIEAEATSKAAETEDAVKKARADAGAKNCDELMQAKAQMASAYTALPEALRKLSRERMEALLQLDNWWVKDVAHPAEWGLIRAEEDPERQPRHISGAMIRGEVPFRPLPLQCDGARRDEQLRWCSDFVHRTLSMDVEVIWNIDTRWVGYRDNYDPSHVEKVVPKKFRGHSLANLKPWPESPVPQVQQQKYIDLLRYRVDHDEEPEAPENPEKRLKNPVLYGWMMMGCRDGGTSKSTMASAYLKDIITARLKGAQNEYDIDVDVDLCVWRIRVPEWIEALEKHKYHDFGDDQRPPEPEVTVAAIRKAMKEYGEKMGWQPILWIEELDKIKATDTRLSWLFNLIDVIYEDKGLLITTTNLTIVELKSMLGGPRLRRLTGTRDKDAHYLVWDFHKYQPRSG